MGLIRHYIRVFIRSHFRPINPRLAKRWETRTSISYFLIAWTAFGYGMYSFFNRGSEGTDTPLSHGLAYTAYDIAQRTGSAKGSTFIFLENGEWKTEVLSPEEIDQKVLENKMRT